MPNTSGKVTVSREVADTLQILIDCGYKKETLVRHHVNKPYEWHAGDTPLNGISLDTLIQALYVGYEVKCTPEEQLADYIEENNRLHREARSTEHLYYHDGAIDGARKAAEILGVKLPEGADAN